MAKALLTTLVRGVAQTATYVQNRSGFGRAALYDVATILKRVAIQGNLQISRILKNVHLSCTVVHVLFSLLCTNKMEEFSYTIPWHLCCSCLYRLYSKSLSSPNLTFTYGPNCVWIFGILGMTIQRVLTRHRTRHLGMIIFRNRSHPSLCCGSSAQTGPKQGCATGHRSCAGYCPLRQCSSGTCPSFHTTSGRRRPRGAGSTYWGTLGSTHVHRCCLLGISELPSLRTFPFPPLVSPAGCTASATFSRNRKFLHAVWPPRTTSVRVGHSVFRFCPRIWAHFDQMVLEGTRCCIYVW